MLRSATANSTHACNHEAPRDPAQRAAYLHAAHEVVPRVLASVDRNPFSPSYGCCDRQYWHYRTAAFPSEMYQEAALPLAQAFAVARPGSAWHGEPRLAEAAVAAMQFSRRNAHADGSADDYYPFERALGAVVFSLVAQSEAYRLLAFDDAELKRFFARRAEWIVGHDESGRLTNHHALAALALWRTAKLVDSQALRRAALDRVEQVLRWQSSEGWFDEYGGADPGYQTVTIECLAKLRLEAQLPHLDEPLHRAVGFARHFMNLDDCIGGVYGSRGTHHFYPAGCELLASESVEAADMADGFLRSLVNHTEARFDDDRMYVHRLGSLFDAYGHWSPTRAVADRNATAASLPQGLNMRHFPQAGIVVADRTASDGLDDDAIAKLIVSQARGGTFQFARRSHGEANRFEMRQIADAGLVVEFDDGRIAVSQMHGLERNTATATSTNDELLEVQTTRALQYKRFERATPLKQAALHVGMATVGRLARGLVRKLLQRRVISGGGIAPLTVRRRITWNGRSAQERLVVVDELTLAGSGSVRKLAFASDLQAAYTAAAEVFSPNLLQPWHDLSTYIPQLNRERRVTIVREF